MCTAITFRAHHRLFGRTLDLEHDYGERITRIPSDRPLHFRHLPAMKEHHAILGMALDFPELPLIFDGMNDSGLAAAGLNFPHSAHYFASAPEGSLPLASFELIPYLLASCATIDQARAALERITILDIPHSEALPPSPLHWMITDGLHSLVAEPMENGLALFDNPVGILTNEPPFPHQLYALSSCLHLSPAPQQNFLGIDLAPYASYSRGMGAIGLPGDSSSTSRFVRAAFTAACASPGESTEEDIAQFYHIAAAAAQVKGCVRLEDGSEVRTVYTSCCDLDAGRYYVERYERRELLWETL